jgi:putative Mg2+ transporter-C (MgtC) family protein
MDSTLLSEADMVIRLSLGFLAGTIIGFERSSRHQMAGLRTHILIATGATLLMILSIWLPQEYNSLKNGDPGRIAAQVVSGIGFLGAGAMIRLGNNVRGVTTAASLWLIAAVGMAIGAGLFIAAVVTELLSLITLEAMTLLEKRFFPAERNKVMNLYFKNKNPDIKETIGVLKSFGVRLQSMDVDRSLDKSEGLRLRLLIGLPNITDIPKLTEAFKEIKGLVNIEMKEKY